ncbi:MAG TPA: SgcJ/EcaC family oxidoreductase [Blastocatellia bacterium]|nr:SgcJ/EcaC family oxidoreductase [Blastocatellia bacterium]
MTKRLLAATAMLMTLCSLGAAQNSQTRAKDEAAIRAIIAGLADAWTRGDSDAWGKAFTTDADFTVWNGTYVKGREAIARGHAQIFGTIYKDTRQRLTVRSIRFLRDDIAAVHVEGSVVKKDEEFPATPQVAPVFIMTKEKGEWLIAVFQNTKIQPPQNASH